MWGWAVLRRFLAAGSLFLMILSAGTGAPIADYGDAPDGLPAGYTGPFEGVIGHFPTLYANQGAHALETPWEEAAFLGNHISWEADACDPNDPDGTPNLIWNDFNDGVKIDPPATLVFKVTIGVEAPEITWYINVLIDLDRSGAWDREEEWVIKNLPVEVAPGGSREISQELPSSVVEALTEYLSSAWMRVALTPSPIDETVPWDGSGEFSSGEIEDYPVVGVEQGTIAIATAEAVAKVATQARAFAEAAAEAQAAVAAAVEAIAEVEAKAQDFVVQIAHKCDRAWKWAEAVADIEVEAHTYMEKIARECDIAHERVTVFNTAIDDCYDYENALELACRRVEELKSKVMDLVAEVPCATVVAHFRAAVAAIAEACAQAHAEAEAVAAAWAEAYAEAEAFAEACADALAVAEAHAKAIAEAKAAALAAAEAVAKAASIAKSSARAAALAAAQATAATQAVGLSLAFGSQLGQTLEVLGAPVVNALAAALTAAEAAAKAAAQAQAAALAAAEAQARAETELEVLAAAFAQAEAYAEAVAEAQAKAKAEADVLSATYAQAEAIAAVVAKAAATAEAICAAKAKAMVLADTVAETMTSLEGAIAAIPRGDCPRELCRLDPPLVTVTITTTVIKEECKEECWTVCGGYEYEECWLECVTTECEEVEKTISGFKILVNGDEYEAPVTIQKDMKSELHLEAPATYTETIFSIWPPSISITIYNFSYWECNGVMTTDRHYVFTLNENVRCKAVYGAQ